MHAGHVAAHLGPAWARTALWALGALGALAGPCPPAWAGPHCDAPPQTWQPRSAVGALAERNGWRVDRLKVDDGCYELHGHDADGSRIKVKLDPASLKVISIKRGPGDHDRDGAHDGAVKRLRPGAAPTAPSSGPGGNTPAGNGPAR